MVPHGTFNDWLIEKGFQRVARLRLPFALEVQRAFAADLMRVGAPVMPPIYQPVTARLLRGGGEAGVYQTMGELNKDEEAFLILTKAGQQCVLIIPFLRKSKALLDDRLNTLRAQPDAKDGRAGTLRAQLTALSTAIEDDSEWAKLRATFELPKMNKSKKFFGDRVEIVCGAGEGDQCSRKVLVAVSLHFEDTSIV